MTEATTPTTYVLVHGAWHDSRSWNRVSRILRDAGHDVVTPDLTGHGEKAALLSPDVDLSTHVRDVVAAIEDRGLRDVVLVGHSYAGMVIASVADRIPERITRLVFVDGMVPANGENAVDVVPATQMMIDAEAASDEPWRIPPLPEFPAPFGLFGVTDPADVAWLRTTLGDESVRCFTESARLGNTAADAIDREHVHCVGFEPEGFARRAVPRIQPNGSASRIHEIRSGHDCMVTEPQALSEILLGAAK